MRANRPIIIGHRGASGYRPEHTLASYWLAIRQGADFIEPDLVSTRDGVLVARHENEIAGTTDVAQHPEFAERRTRKQIDGREVEGFFTEDFTLAELQTLHARERLPELRQGNTRFDGLYRVPTFDAVLSLARRASRLLGRAIGVYPETKHPSYFAGLGLALEPPLLRALARGRVPVFIQSFEVSNLQALRQQTQLPLVQLIGAAERPYDFVLRNDRRELTTPEGLAEIARYADAIGVDKALLIPRGEQGELLAPTTLAEDAHAAGLKVHAWTFRRENAFLPRDYQRGGVAADSGDLTAECRRFLALGVDGLFADNPDRAVVARRQAESAPR